MGVVYKAKQVGLNRMVALKMILAGAHASAQEQNRFRIEAEAVAQLVHPNVVQIYEIGQHDGLPYFSLEYVDGGSLAGMMKGRPLPGRQTAELIQTLARAVHAAHQRGIVHRDLKPANVLLTRDGTPKITDFGLAKKLDTDSNKSSGNTRSGTVMGTPSYMAPEQAGDKDKQIGPHTDVYALGAILYECLTGRPPFRCDNPVETVLQVLDHEPEAPRSFNKEVDPSLEAICLKCLEKNPRDRYTRAQDLADDLGNYLNGEPVKADRTTSLRLFRVFLRETRHTEVMALWGKVWMWHAAIMLVLLVVTALLIPFTFTQTASNTEQEAAWPFVAVWSLGLAALAVPVWHYRFRSGLALTLIERQMGQVWSIFTIGILLTIGSQYFSGPKPSLELSSLLPLLMLEFGLAFGCMAVILGGSFYGMALACVIVAILETAASRLDQRMPALTLGVVIFGVVFFVGLFLPGLRYSRAAKA
jgi:serine/threonine-protein kinase